MTRLPLSRLEAISAAPTEYYREAHIVTGSGKSRTLHVPSRDLKLAQKRILRRILGRLDPHPCSACVTKRGTHWVYKRHAAHRAMLCLDLADFFPSVKREAVVRGFSRLGADDNVAPTLTDLVTLPDRLPQGAPTSVAVADVVLFPLDRRIAGLAEAKGFTYSRYVDDLTLSGGSRLAGFERLVRRIVTEEGWVINEKGGVFGPDQRHEVLGAVVNQKPNVSRECFGTVRSFLRRVSRGDMKMAMDDFEKLDGKVRWILSVNPERERVLKPLLQSAAQATQKSS